MAVCLLACLFVYFPDATQTETSQGPYCKAEKKLKVLSIAFYLTIK